MLSTLPLSSCFHQSICPKRPVRLAQTVSVCSYHPSAPPSRRLPPALNSPTQFGKFTTKPVRSVPRHCAWSCPRQPSGPPPSASSSSASVSLSNCFALLSDTDDDEASQTDLNFDTGCTFSLVPPTTKLTNETPVPRTNITSACSGIIQATSTGCLNLPQLPVAATEALKAPVHTPLLSVGRVCDEDCTAVFTKEKAVLARNADIDITYKKPPLLTALRNSRGLWSTNPSSAPGTPPLALSAYRQRTKSKLLQYLHGCAIGTPKSTLIKAIKKNWFVSWPGFTADDV